MTIAVIPLGRMHALSFALAKAGADSDHCSRNTGVFLLSGCTDATTVEPEYLRQAMSFVEGRAIDIMPGTSLGAPLTLCNMNVVYYKTLISVPS